MLIPNETREQAFARLATARMNRVLRDMHSLEKLANPNYKWTPAWTQQIITTLYNEVRNVERKLARDKDAPPQFMLEAITADPADAASSFSPDNE